MGFVATVRVSLLDSGASHEDCGCGEGIHESKLKAIDTAMKSAITDAMKRAARHFGERLGNGEQCVLFSFLCIFLTIIILIALYVAGSGMHRAPIDNKMALRDLERQEALNLFGNQKALYELRAKNMEDAAHQDSTTEQDAAADGGKPPANPSDGNEREPKRSHQAAPALERQMTPPGLAASFPHGNYSTNRNSPPQLIGHGFTRASELGVTVTPGQQGTCPQHSTTLGTTNTSPLSTRTLPTSRPSPPPVPRYTPLTEQSPPNNSNQQTHAIPTKRQKIVHNPYHN